MFWQFAKPNIKFELKPFKKQALLAAARLGTHFMRTKVLKITISKNAIKTTVYWTISFDTLGSKLEFLTYLKSSLYHLLGAIQRLLAPNTPVQRQLPSLLRLKRSPVRRCEFRQTRQYIYHHTSSYAKKNTARNSTLRGQGPDLIAKTIDFAPKSRFFAAAFTCFCLLRL